jgi:hypothetical protein
VTHSVWGSGALGRVLVGTALLPVMAVGMLLDVVLRPLLERPGVSNTYRVVAGENRDIGADEPAPLRASA